MNQAHLEILQRNIVTEKLHKDILNNYSGSYSLGIGLSEDKTQYILALSVPIIRSESFIDAITLENVIFPVVTKYDLELIMPQKG